MSNPTPTDQAGQLARAAAQQLTSTYGSRLPIDVEAALHAGRAPERYFDPISVASLVVSVATLAWTVYTDLKQKNPQPPARQVVERAVRVEMRTRYQDLPAGIDHLIETVVEEIDRVEGH